MPRRRRRSPLLQALDEAQEGLEDLKGPSEPSLRPKESSDAEIAWAYCPLLKQRTGAGTCGDVDCERCVHLDAFLQEHHPDYVWVCSTCAEDMKILPYWAGGHCEACGYESPVLMLAVPW